MPLFLVTCVCDEGLYPNSFRVFEAQSRLDVARQIWLNRYAWQRWLELSKLWPRERDEEFPRTPEELLREIDATHLDGDSDWQLRILEVPSVERLPSEPTAV